MKTVMELVKEFEYLGEVGIAEEKQATDTDMQSLEEGIEDEIFYDNISLRQATIKKAGFNLFVNPEFALNFKYAASIYTLAQRIGDVYSARGLVYGGIESKKKQYAFESGSEPYYTGTLPLFALNRVRLAVGLGVRHITIHSNEPIEYTKADPVIVGWQGFTIHDYLVCHNKPNKNPRWLRTYPKGQYSAEEKNPFGFIIAMFGEGDVL